MINVTTFELDRSEVSATISFLRFPLTVMIVMYHCYCVQVPINQPLYASLVYPFGLMLGETGVPAFFFISGFLYYLSQRSTVEKLRTRLSTLLTPYIIWNSVIIIAYITIMLIGYPLEIAGKNISDYNFTDYVRAYIDRGYWDNGNGQPMLCPYWYIRNLMVLCLLAPLIQYLLKGSKGMFVLVCSFAWWMSIPYNGMLPQSILFFCLGAFFSVNKTSILSMWSVNARGYLVGIWLTLVLWDWIGHFLIPTDYGLYIHRMVLLLNIFVIMHIGHSASKKFRFHRLLPKSCFWIYTTHYPLTLVVREMRPSLYDGEQLIFYWVTVLVILTLCTSAYCVGQMIFPRTMALLTGNR